ncbi:MAG: IS1595 family transposase [Rhodospirillaceae bacterium]|nr:IS1595 family transposase [Magnetovibrio sp.]MAY66062.1 IS1595 family transposase [Rhodospirillaceae bacterium]
MSKPETISLYEFFQQFPDEEAARLFFEQKRWPNGVECPHCGSHETSECKDHKPMPYRCRSCRKHFSVRVGTVLAESRLPLHKWLMAIYMMTTARKGIPSTQMARELGTTQKTAWFLAQRIRETWMASIGGGDMGPTVEVDETFVGGRERNKHSNKKLRAGRGAVGKQPVIGIMERGGRVIAGPIPSTDGPTLKGVIRYHVAPGSTVYTDNHAGYRGMRGYNHASVNHGVGEYVREQAHTNGIESFWSLLKRGYYGIYHYMSVKHLHRYVNEFSFRHNTAKVDTIDFMGMTAARMVGLRLTYKELTHG